MNRTARRYLGFFLSMALLTVMIGCAGSETSRSTGTYIDDKTISTKVKAQLAGDPVTSATQIQVETYGGVVQLSGFVDSQKSIDRAVEIARNVQGVKEVKNSLQVRGKP